MPEKCCMYLNRVSYDEVASELGMYIGRFETEFDVKPFMLNHRDYILYVLDTTGMPPSTMISNVVRFAEVAKAWPTRVFAVWTAASWSHLHSLDKSATQLPNVVFCDTPTWVEDLVIALKRCRRIVDEREYGGED